MQTAAESVQANATGALVLDFRELRQDGEELELLTRETALALDYEARWAGRGADGGRDLLVIERGHALFGAKRRIWLASCKHTAHAGSGSGRSVSGEDVGSDGGIVDAVSQHEADGYLLVCSTQPSSSLVTRLEAIERTKGVPVHVWDGVQLERMLTTPRAWSVAQRFFPVSAKASGWEVFATASPNRFVVVTRGLYIRLENRHGSRMPYQLTSLDERLDAIAVLQHRLPAGHELRLREVFCDDKHGDFTWYVDYLYGRVSWAGPPAAAPEVSMQAIERALGDGTVTYSDGQIDMFNVTLRSVDRDHDAYDADHYSFYGKLSGF